MEEIERLAVRKRSILFLIVSLLVVINVIRSLFDQEFIGVVSILHVITDREWVVVDVYADFISVMDAFTLAGSAFSAIGNFSDVLTALGQFFGAIAQVVVAIVSIVLDTLVSAFNLVALILQLFGLVRMDIS